MIPKLSKIIGIISYLPDNPNIRALRKSKLKALVLKCIELFKLPIYIVIQNYTEEDIKEFLSIGPLVCLSNNSKPLGIVGARKALREWFLSTQFDYLIMFDDDTTLMGDSGEAYLNQIEENPDCFIEFNKSRMRLFAISHKIFELQDWPDIEVEKEGGFEDRIFFYSLCNKYPDKHKKFSNTGLIERGLATKDPSSTWYKNQNIKKMLENTESLIEGKN